MTPWAASSGAASFGPRSSSLHLIRGAIRLAVGFALLLAAACSPAETQPPQAAVLPAAQEAAPSATASPAPARAAVFPAVDPSAFSGANARRHVDELTGTIGSRPAGSEQERGAATYLVGQLAQWGYQVEQQPFSFTTFEDHSQVQLITGGPSDVPASLITRSAQGTVRGTLADAGLGNTLKPGSLTGRIALLERGQLTFENKVSRAAQAGASAALIYNNQPGLFRGVMQNPSTIPGLTISREEGQRLRQALSAGAVEVEVRASAERIIQESQNVVARAGRECAVVIGGHYDSVPQGPGANDNASGTGTMVEAARVLAPVASDGKLCFVAFGAEEVGLYGSRAFVDQLNTGQRQAIRGMINLDMVGVGNTWQLIGDEGMARKAGEAAERVGVRTRTGRDPENAGSDHQSFIRAGIPAVFIYLSNDPMYHTPQDTADRIDPGNLESAGRIAVALAQDLLTPGQS